MLDPPALFRENRIVVGEIDSPSRLGYRKLCRRENTAGHAHALTFSCFRRQPLLSRERTRQWFTDALELARRKHDFDLWAFVIMPEHVHVLIWPRPEHYSISGILGTLKLPVTRRAAAFVRQHAPSFLGQMIDGQRGGRQQVRFWQRGGGYDRNLWTPRHIWETIDYIHANPVRRELCDHPLDWPWSSARYYGVGEPAR